MRIDPVRWWVWLLLSVVLAGTFGLNLWVIARDQVPDTYDPMHLERDGRLLARGLFGPSGGLDAFFTAVARSDYPVAVHYITLPMRLVLGDVPRAGAVGVALLALLTVSATFGLGHALAGERAGLLAAVLLAATPAFYRFNRFEIVDGPLAAMTALAMLVFIRSDLLAKRGWAVLFGLACALAALTKQSFPLYAMLPVAWAVVSALRTDPRPRRNQRLFNLLLALAIVGGIATAYYLPGIADWVRSRLAWRTFATTTDHIRVSQYPWLMVTHGLGWLLAAVTVVAILLLPKRGSNYAFLALWLLPPLLFLGPLFGLLTTRYLLPLLPPAALLAALWLDSLISHRRKVGWGIALAVVVAMLATMADDHLRADRRPFALDSFEARLQLEGIPRPQRLDWNVYAPVGRLAADATGRRLLLLFDTPYSNLVHEALWERDPRADVVNLFENVAHRHVPPELADPAALEAYLTAADYLLVHGGLSDEPRYYSQVQNVDHRFAQQVFTAFLKVKDRFDLIDQYPHPEDRHSVLLYRRR